MLFGRLSAGAAEEKLARSQCWCGGVLVVADRHVKEVTSAQTMEGAAVLLAEAMPVGADATVVDTAVALRGRNPAVGSVVAAVVQIPVVDIAADRAAPAGQADSCCV